MMKVRCVHKPDLNGPVNFTPGEIYAVIRYVPATSDFRFDYATVIDDRGQESTFRATNRYFTNGFFEDVTSEYRDIVIDNILL